jgi:coatomer protein complex subunit alpha (xenin)
MAKIAEMRGDQMSKFHNALYLGNVEARIDVLREVGLCTFLFPLSP